MTVDRALIGWVEEAMAPVGAVSFRRMMGGATLYCDGIVFAIVDGDGALWFKSDAQADAEWDAAGCARFTYEREGRSATMNYRAAPADVYDDAEALRHWGMVALAAGHRAPARPKRR